MLIVGALAGRITIRTKTAKRVNDMGQKMITLEKKLDEHLVESEERNELILESLLAIMLTLKKGSANGEIDGALERLNSYTIRKGSK